MTSHVEPASSELDRFVGMVGFSYDSNMKQTPRFLKFPELEQNNFMKVEILQDGLYRITHKEELQLDSSDREVFTYINRLRDGQNVELCVYHIQ
jgi:hypothetical protein